MEEKKERKVRISTVIFILVILVLVLGIVGMWYYYNNIANVSKDNEKPPLSDNKSTIEDDTEVSEIKALNINDKIVTELYDSIVKINYYEETLVYQKNKVTLSNIDNQLKLLTIFQNLKEEDGQKVKATEYTGVIEDDGNSYKYLYTKETVEEKAKEIFGQTATVRHEDCSPWDGYSRIYENGVYTCFAYAGGGDVPWSMSIAFLLKAESEGDYIYIYDNYIHMVEVANIVNGVYYSGTYDLYATSDRQMVIFKNINLRDEGVYEGTSNLSSEEFNKTYKENLFKICGDKLKTFKHTFKKDDNGNYCWISTEIAD